MSEIRSCGNFATVVNKFQVVNVTRVKKKKEGTLVKNIQDIKTFKSSFEDHF